MDWLSEEVWSTKKAADHLGKSMSFVARLCKKGVLRHKLVGGVYVIDPRSVEEYKNAPKSKGGRPRKAQE